MTHATHLPFPTALHVPRTADGAIADAGDQGWSATLPPRVPGPWDPAMVATLLATLPVGVLLLREDGTPLYVNDAARELWRAAHATAAPSPLDALVARALLAAETVRGEELELVGSPWADDLRGRRSVRWVRVTAVPVRDARCHVNALVVHLEDISARKELAQLQPMLDSIARL